MLFINFHHHTTNPARNKTVSTGKANSMTSNLVNISHPAYTDEVRIISPTMTQKRTESPCRFHNNFSADGFLVFTKSRLVILLFLHEYDFAGARCFQASFRNTLKGTSHAVSITISGSNISFTFKLEFILVHLSTLSVMSVNLNTTLYPDSPCVKVFYNKSYEPNRSTLSATIIGFRVIPL